MSHFALKKELKKIEVALTRDTRDTAAQELGKTFFFSFFLNKTVQICYPIEPSCLKHLVQLLVISRQQTEMLFMHFNRINYNDTENCLKWI